MAECDGASGQNVLLAFAIVVVVALGTWAYGKHRPERAGRVRPDAPPSAEEKRRAEGK